MFLRSFFHLFYIQRILERFLHIHLTSLYCISEMRRQLTMNIQINVFINCRAVSCEMCLYLNLSECLCNLKCNQTKRCAVRLLSQLLN